MALSSLVREAEGLPEGLANGEVLDADFDVAAERDGDKHEQGDERGQVGGQLLEFAGCADLGGEGE